MAGQGFALLTPLLWKGDVAAGRLQCRSRTAFLPGAGPIGWSTRAERRLVPKVKRFREWLISEMERLEGGRCTAAGRNRPQPAAE